METRILPVFRRLPLALSKWHYFSYLLSHVFSSITHETAERKRQGADRLSPCSACASPERCRYPAVHRRRGARPAWRSTPAARLLLRVPGAGGGGGGLGLRSHSVAPRQRSRLPASNSRQKLPLRQPAKRSCPPCDHQLGAGVVLMGSFALVPRKFARSLPSRTRERGDLEGRATTPGVPCVRCPRSAGGDRERALGSGVGGETGPGRGEGPLGARRCAGRAAAVPETPPERTISLEGLPRGLNKIFFKDS